MKLVISQAGSFTTIQDSGRFGLAHLGVPVSGYMDKPAAQLANHMVGNDLDLGLLEVTWTGVGFISDVACSIAVTGAVFECTVNESLVNTDHVIHLNEGDEFRMERLLSGVRAYIAVAGGFDLPQIGGSVSTLCVAQLGGHEGRPLQVRDQIKLLKASQVQGKQIPLWKKIKQQHIHIIRAIPGPEISQFDPITVKQAFGQPYQLSKDSNRQGFRLHSESINYPADLNMSSTGLVTGSLQITPNGQSILAMNDAQTTGGYPRILVVNQDEVHKLAQIRPSEDIYFFVSNL